MTTLLADLRRDHPWQHGRFGGLEWRWRDTGGLGRPLLLLPGALGTADIFAPVVPALAQERRIVLLDYPAADIEALTDGLAALIPYAFGHPRAKVLGASFAGRWLQDAAARHPGRFAHLILANSFADSDEIARHPLFDLAALRGRGPDATKAAWRQVIAGAPVSPLRDLQAILLEEQPADVLHDRLLRVATAPSAPAPAVIASIIECADDPLIPPATQAGLRAHLPHAPVARLARGGHYPHVVAPDEYVEALRCLLAQQPMRACA